MQTRDPIWTVRGVVVRGERRGRELGYPTANVYTDTADLPEDGVYAGFVILDVEPGIRRAAAISVGSNPTFGATRRTVEAYLLDWDGDLYGRGLQVQGCQRLRGMTAFASVEELLTAMAEDVDRARAVLGVTDRPTSPTAEGTPIGRPDR